MNKLALLGVVDLTYLLFGAFVIEPGRGMKKNLEEACGIIRNGGNVVMYPEGSIMYDGGIGEFKKGAAVLAHATGAPVLPLSMKISKGKYFRKTYTINIGDIIHTNQKNSNVEFTRTLRDIVCNLYNKKT